MTRFDVIRAWKDASHCAALTGEHRSRLRRDLADVLTLSSNCLQSSAVAPQTVLHHATVLHLRRFLS
jgi:hypothetical protein